MEFPRLGVELELQLLAYATATATWAPSHIFEIHHSSRQCWILNPLSEARDKTRILMNTGQVRYQWATTGPKFRFFSHHRRNSERRWKLRKKSEDLFKWEIHLSKRVGKRGEQLPWLSLACWLYGAFNCMNGIFTGKVGFRGSYSLIFILNFSVLPSQRKEWFLSLFGFFRKCHGISAWWLLLICIANFIIILL